MFVLWFDKKGNKILKWSNKITKTSSYERGFWVEVGHRLDRETPYFVEINRKNGLDVVMDEHGYYRALVLKD